MIIFMKKVVSILLSILLVFSAASVSAYAQDDDAADTAVTIDGAEIYPFIFVHGMGAWGSYESFNKIMPNWGGWGFHAESDITKIFTENGIKAYAASVGPFNSAWDRACELYAQLTGTVTDYGESHSKAHNHDRYGYSFVGNQLMEECWDGVSTINLVGHSFGVPTVRLFASLMAFGDEEEINATGRDTSPLFTGGKSNTIHAVVGLAGPNNGSPIANMVYDSDAMKLISVGLNLMGFLFGEKMLMWTFQLSHFGLTPKQGEGRAKLDLSKAMNFYHAEDNCGYDMTLRGAAALNEKIKLSPDTYYYSYSAIATETDEFDNEQPIDTMFSIFKSSARKLGAMDGQTVDGFVLDKNWEINDGLVPLASALYPADDADTALPYEETVASGATLEPGRWYYMEPMRGFDHFDFSGTRDYPTSFEDFYFSMANVVNAKETSP